MTVPSQTPKVSYTANGATKSFPFSFRIRKTNHLAVFVGLVPQTLGTHYSVTSTNLAAGGSVVFVNAPANGEKVKIYRNMPYSRTDFDYQTSGSFPAATINEDLDSLALQVQQLAEVVDRSMTIGRFTDGVSTVLPPPNPNKLLSWNQDASALTNVALENFLTAQTYANWQWKPFTGNGVQTVFALDSAPGTIANLDLSVNGATMVPNDDFTLSGATITFSVAPPNGSSILARYGSYQTPEIWASNQSVITAGTTTARILEERFGDIVNIKDNGAIPGGSVDAKNAIINTLASHDIVFIDSVYKVTGTITVPSSKKIFGNGRSGRLDFYGCDGLKIEGVGGDGVTIEGVAMLSYSSVGVPDPRLYSAIYCHGTSGHTVNDFRAENLYLQGWNTGINWSYTATSAINDIYTINCEFGVVYFGQSANNTISDSKLVCNNGQASVKLIPDGSVVGEGLMISNSLLASGAYGVDSGTGFFSLQVSNCIVDLIGNTAFNLTDCKDFKLTNSFVYAAAYGAKLAALGVPVTQNTSMTGNTFRMSGSSGTAIHIGSNNYGVNILGCSFDLSGTETGIYSEGKHVGIGFNHFANTGTGYSIHPAANIPEHQIGFNTGDISYGGGFTTWTVSDGSGAALTFTITGTPRYEKHGRLCVCSLDITFPTTANGSLAKVSLPFVSDALNFAGLVGYTDYGSALSVQTVGGEQYFRFLSGSTFLTNANLSGKRAVITFSYVTT